MIARLTKYFALICIFAGLFHSALAERYQTFSKPQEAKANVATVDSLINLAAEVCESNPALSKSYAESAYSAALKINYMPGLARARRLFGKYFLHGGNYKIASDYFQKSLNDCERLDLYSDLIDVCVDIASLRYKAGEHEKFEQRFDKAAEIAKKRGLEEKLPEILFVKGELLFESGEYESAFSNYEQAAQSWQATRNFYLAKLYLRKSEYFEKNGDLEKALSYAQKSLEAAPDDYPGKRCDILRSIAELQIQAGDAESALQNLTTAISTSRQASAPLETAKTLVDLGSLSILEKKYADAANNFKEALNIAEKAGDADIKLKALYGLQEALAKLGRIAESRKVLLQYAQTADAESRAEKDLQLNTLRKTDEFEIEKLSKKYESVTEKYGKLREENETLVRNLFIAGSILFIGFIIINILRFRARRRDHIKLRIAHERLEAVHGSLLAAHKDLETTHDQLEAAHKEVRHAKEIIEKKNAEIISSITYAEKIQKAILPMNDKLKSAFNDVFIIFMPRDIISGDFYWFAVKSNYIFVAAVDCAGHGVPGSMLSMIGSTLLSEIVTQMEIYEPARILEKMHVMVRNVLKQETGLYEAKDSMDVSLCRIDKNSNILSYSGARQPLIYATGGEIQVVNGDRKTVGGRQREEKRSFTQTDFEVKSGDSAYLFSDGITDQFNPYRKKLGSKNFRRMIEKTAREDFSRQKGFLTQMILNHKRDAEQIDDIMIIGIKF